MEDGTKTVGPFTGRRFTGYCLVKRYDPESETLHSFIMPPCHEVLCGSDDIGFIAQQIRTSIGLDGTTEDEEHRQDAGALLWGSDLHWGTGEVMRALRKADILEGNEGYGG